MPEFGATTTPPASTAPPPLQPPSEWLTPPARAQEPAPSPTPDAPQSPVLPPPSTAALVEGTRQVIGGADDYDRGSLSNKVQPESFGELVRNAAPMLTAPMASRGINQGLTHVMPKVGPRIAGPIGAVLQPIIGTAAQAAGASVTGAKTQGDYINEAVEQDLLNLQQFRDKLNSSDDYIAHLYANDQISPEELQNKLQQIEQSKRWVNGVLEDKDAFRARMQDTYKGMMGFNAAAPAQDTLLPLFSTLNPVYASKFDLSTPEGQKAYEDHMKTWQPAARTLDNVLLSSSAGIGMKALRSPMRLGLLNSAFRLVGSGVQAATSPTVANAWNNGNKLDALGHIGSLTYDLAKNNVKGELNAIVDSASKGNYGQALLQTLDTVTSQPVQAGALIAGEAATEDLPAALDYAKGWLTGASGSSLDKLPQAYIDEFKDTPEFAAKEKEYAGMTNMQRRNFHAEQEWLQNVRKTNRSTGNYKNNRYVYHEQTGNQQDSVTSTVAGDQPMNIEALNASNAQQAYDYMNAKLNGGDLPLNRGRAIDTNANAKVVARYQREGKPAPFYTGAILQVDRPEEHNRYDDKMQGTLKGDEKHWNTQRWDDWVRQQIASQRPDAVIANIKGDNVVPPSQEAVSAYLDRTWAPLEDRISKINNPQVKAQFEDLQKWLAKPEFADSKQLTDRLQGTLKVLTGPYDEKTKESLASMLMGNLHKDVWAGRLDGRPQEIQQLELQMNRNFTTATTNGISKTKLPIAVLSGSAPALMNKKLLPYMTDELWEQYKKDPKGAMHAASRAAIADIVSNPSYLATHSTATDLPEFKKIVKYGLPEKEKATNELTSDVTEAAVHIARASQLREQGNAYDKWINKTRAEDGVSSKNPGEAAQTLLSVLEPARALLPKATPDMIANLDPSVLAAASDSSTPTGQLYGRLMDAKNGVAAAEKAYKETKTTITGGDERTAESNLLAAKHTFATVLKDFHRSLKTQMTLHQAEVADSWAKQTKEDYQPGNTTSISSRLPVPPYTADAVERFVRDIGDSTDVLQNPQLVQKFSIINKYLRSKEPADNIAASKLLTGMVKDYYDGRLEGLEANPLSVYDYGRAARQRGVAGEQYNPMNMPKPTTGNGPSDSRLLFMLRNGLGADINEHYKGSTIRDVGKLRQAIRQNPRLQAMLLKELKLREEEPSFRSQSKDLERLLSE